MDVLPGVAIDGVVADEEHPPVGDRAREDEAGPGTARARPRPGGAGEGALVVGPVARGERPEGAEQIRDGVPAPGEEGGGEEEGEPPIGRSRGMRREGREQRRGLVG
jgi:hypothetical protein